MITLKKLTLNRWLSYDHAEFDLSEDGVTLIKGQSGCGKSAICEAISYLLFGELIRKKTSVDDLSNKIINVWFAFLYDGVYA